MEAEERLEGAGGEGGEAQQASQDTEMQGLQEGAEEHAPESHEGEGEVLYYVDADGNRIDPQDMQDFALAPAEGEEEHVAEDAGLSTETNGQQVKDGQSGDAAMQIHAEGEDYPAHLEAQSTSAAALTPDEVQTGSAQSQLETEAGASAGAAEETQEDIQAQAARFERPFRPLSSLHTTSSKSNGYSQSEEALKPDYRLRYILTGHRKNVSCIKFSPDGKYLITAGGDGRILLYSLPQHSTASPSSSRASAQAQGPVFIRSYTIPTPPPVKIRPPRTSSSIAPVGCAGINDLCFSPCSRYFATASDDKIVRIWKVDPFPRDKDILDESMAEKDQDSHKAGGSTTNANGGVGEAIHGMPPTGTNGVAQQHHNTNGTQENDTVLPSSALSGAAEHPIELKGHTSFVFCVAFTPQGNLLASGSYDETVRIWDVKRGRCLKILPAHSDPVAGVGFSGDGSILCSAGHDGLLRLWDTASGQCLKSLVDESNPPASHAAFTPNSRYILVSSLDSTLRLWDYHAAVCVKTYKGHENVKYHIPAIFHLPPKGKTGQAYIITGSEDGRITFYDLQSRNIAMTLPGHKSDPILCLALDQHSGMLATSARERGVDEYQTKLWVDVNRLAPKQPLSNGLLNGQ